MEIRGENDTDMLTDMELKRRGLSPRFPKMTELTSLPAPIARNSQKCCYCNKVVNSPVSKFERFGYDFIPKNKVAHEGCVKRQFEAMKEVFLAMEKEK